jgi:CPA1 family monovalent cation:H+ antiporter
MHDIDFPLLGILLFVSSLVAMVTRRLNLPYSVGLVTAGIILALLPFGLEMPLTPELVFSVFLPPLVFEAAIQIPWRPFRRELPVLLLLVTVGVLLAAAIVAVGMHYLIGWSWIGAAFFGVLIAAGVAACPLAIATSTAKATAATPSLSRLSDSTSKWSR